jgi:hypothetical protein
MNEEQLPDVEEIKSRLGDEIPVEEEPAAYKAETGQADVVDELADLGRQFGETLRSAWYSAERRRFESELREGVNSFVDEIDNAFREVKDSPAGQRTRDESTRIKIEVESSEMSGRAKSSIASGLHWLSTELGNLADQFTPQEKSAEDEEED